MDHPDDKKTHRSKCPALFLQQFSDYRNFKTEINEINKPRDEALAAKVKPKAQVKLVNDVVRFARRLGGFKIPKNDAEDTTGVKTAEGSENTKESGTKASTKAKK
jgi:hypothetical protein